MYVKYVVPDMMVHSLRPLQWRASTVQGCQTVYYWTLVQAILVFCPQCYIEKFVSIIATFRYRNKRVLYLLTAGNISIVPQRPTISSNLIESIVVLVVHDQKPIEIVLRL